MNRAAFRLLALSIGLLQACQPKPEAGPTASAVPTASAPEGAADDTPAALMAQAFEGWTDKQAHALSVPSFEAGKGEMVDVLVSPALVVTLDTNHRALVVTGPPDAGGGEAQKSHANGANVGVYGFERRNGRWFKTYERPSLTWTGFFGEAGELKIHRLAGGRTALSIENGSCWQGRCGSWLKLFAVGTSDAKALFDQRMNSSSLGATIGCEEWLKGKPLAAGEAMTITPESCFDINGTWRFEAKDGDSSWPDVVLTFTGGEAAQEAKDAPVVARAIDGQMVLRHDGAGYKALHGRNPTHDF